MKQLVTLIFSTLGLITLAHGQTSLPLSDERVVVELYTSQGCSSCPPADRYLGTLVQDESVLGLGLHVTYWDRLGWVDPLGIEGFSTRQAQTNVRLRNRAIRVTPQMVVQGQFESSGSGGRHRSVIDTAIDTIQDQEIAEPLAWQLVKHDGSLTVQVGNLGEQRNLVAHLVAFKPETQADIRRGENAGRQLTYTNSVVFWASARVGADGQAAFDADLIAQTGSVSVNWAIILQDGAIGPIRSARQVLSL